MRARTMWGLGLGVALLLGCGGRNQAGLSPDAAMGPDSASCKGQRVLVVTNDWNQSVEVFSKSETSAVGTSLGVVGPGERQEIVVLPGQRAYLLPTPQLSYIPPAMKQLVRTRYICR